MIIYNLVSIDRWDKGRDVVFSTILAAALSRSLTMLDTLDGVSCGKWSWVEDQEQVVMGQRSRAGGHVSRVKGKWLCAKDQEKIRMSKAK